MGLRIRRSDKTVIDLPKEAIFVELVGEDGQLLGVIHENRQQGSINFFDGNSDKALRYKQFYGVDFVKKGYMLNASNLNLSSPKKV